MHNLQHTRSHHLLVISLRSVHTRIQVQAFTAYAGGKMWQDSIAVRHYIQAIGATPYLGIPQKVPSCVAHAWPSFQSSERDSIGDLAPEDHWLSEEHVSSDSLEAVEQHPCNASRKSTNNKLQCQSGRLA